MTDTDYDNFLNDVRALGARYGLTNYVLSFEADDADGAPKYGTCGLGTPAELAINAARLYGAMRERLEAEFVRTVAEGRAGAKK